MPETEPLSKERTTMHTLTQPSSTGKNESVRIVSYGDCEPSAAERWRFAGYEVREDVEIEAGRVSVEYTDTSSITWVGHVDIYPDNQTVILRPYTDITALDLARFYNHAQRIIDGWWPQFMVEGRESAVLKPDADGRDRYHLNYGIVYEQEACTVPGCVSEFHMTEWDLPNVKLPTIHRGQSFTPEHEGETVYEVVSELDPDTERWHVYASVHNHGMLTPSYASGMASDLAWVAQEVAQLNAVLDARKAVNA